MVAPRDVGGVEQHAVGRVGACRAVVVVNQALASGRAFCAVGRISITVFALRTASIAIRTCRIVSKEWTRAAEIPVGIYNFQEWVDTLHALCLEMVPAGLAVSVAV